MSTLVSKDLIYYIITFLDITEERQMLQLFDRKNTKQLKKLWLKDSHLEIEHNRGWVIKKCNGKIHAEDEPAEYFFQRPDYRVYIGTVVTWKIAGENHNENGGPSHIDKDYKLWQMNGRLHRIGGPAVEHANGETEYWLQGKQYSRGSYYRRLRMKKSKK